MLLQQPNGGRIVEVDDPDEARLLLARGFTEPTEEQTQQYYADRQRRFAESHQEQLPETGLDVHFRTARARGDGYGMSSANFSKELAKLGIRLNPEYRNQKVGMVYHRPNSIVQLQTEVRILYTMFESTRIPADWPQYCNYADLVLVPSHWCQRIFGESGVPTEVVPLGYNDDKFTYIDRPVPIEENKDFVFLHYNAFNIRKGFPEVLKAFLKAFKPTDPVKLILKTTLDSPPLPLPKKEYPNIEIITGDVSESELTAILARSNCFVFPSRGEGFGIPPLEAMATGLPAIVPNAHGISEYFHPGYMYEVKVGDTCPAIYHSFKKQDVGKMVVCDVDDLARQMRHVFHHQQAAKELGQRASEYVKKFTYKETARQLSEIITKYQNEPVKRRRDADMLQVDVL